MRFARIALSHSILQIKFNFNVPEMEKQSLQSHTIDNNLNRSNIKFRFSAIHPRQITYSCWIMPIILHYTVIISPVSAIIP